LKIIINTRYKIKIKSDQIKSKQHAEAFPKPQDTMTVKSNH